MEQTIARQNPHWDGRPFEGLAARDVMSNLLPKQTLPHIQILTGVRRCGKSTIFKLLINDLMARGENPKSILNVNLDAPAFIPYWDDVARLTDLVSAAERLTGERVRWLFLDEVQQVRDWEVFVKDAYDAQSFSKMFVTGSNSNLLANRFSSMLAGRYFANEVRPFSLREVFAAGGVSSRLEAVQNVGAVLRMADSALRLGTFPEIVLGQMTDDVKAELLHSYFDSIVQKDCIVYNKIRDPHLFYKCSNFILRSVGSLFSLQQLGKAVGSNENTVDSYLDYLCDSYICADVRNFSFSLKESKRSDHKCYCIDNGLMAANTMRFSPDAGHFLENLVFNELVNKGYTDIAFDNGKGECDFLARRDGALHAFQVCYELTDFNRQREFAGFDNLKAAVDSRTIITFNQKEPEAQGVSVVPLWDWVLGD